MGNLSNFVATAHLPKPVTQMIGEFRFGIVDAQMIDDDYGKVVKVQLQCVDEPYEGRTLYDWIRVKGHKSPRQRDFHLARLSSLMFAADKPEADDTQDIVGCTIRCKISKQRKWDKDTQSYVFSDDYSEVEKYVVENGEEKRLEAVDRAAEDVF